MDHHTDPGPLAAALPAALVCRAFAGDRGALRSLHELAYLAPEHDPRSGAARWALRAVGGPRPDGHRPPGTGPVDAPWVTAVLDRLHAARAAQRPPG